MVVLVPLPKRNRGILMHLSAIQTNRFFTKPSGQSGTALQKHQEACSFPENPHHLPLSHCRQSRQGHLESTNGVGWLSVLVWMQDTRESGFYGFMQVAAACPRASEQ